MKLGPVIHGILLVAALLFGYQTWTRDKTVTTKTGTIAVWSNSPKQLVSVNYETEKRNVTVVQKEATDGTGGYLWGTEVRTITVRKPSTTPKDDGHGHGAHGMPAKKPEPATKPKDPKAAGEKPGEAADKPDEKEEKPPETKTETSDFPVGDKGEELFENFGSLKALRSLGVLEQEKLKDYSLEESKSTINVAFKDSVRSLLVGGRVYGGSDRYVLDPETNTGYVIAGSFIQPLESGASSLRLRNVHKWEMKDAKKVTVAVGERKRSLVAMKTKDENGEEREAWADAKKPSDPDLTMDNFLDRVSKLTPIEYKTDVKKEDLSLLVRVDYQTERGNALGFLEIYKKDPPADSGSDTPETTPAEGAKDDTAAKEESVAKPPVKPGAKKAADKATPANGSKPPTPTDANKPPAKPKAQAEYYIITERTRLLGFVSRFAAERIDQDLSQIFE